MQPRRVMKLHDETRGAGHVSVCAVFGHREHGDAETESARLTGRIAIEMASAALPGESKARLPQTVPAGLAPAHQCGLCATPTGRWRQDQSSCGIQPTRYGGGTVGRSRLMAVSCARLVMPSFGKMR